MPVPLFKRNVGDMKKALNFVKKKAGKGKKDGGYEEDPSGQPPRSPAASSIASSSSTITATAGASGGGAKGEIPPRSSLATSKHRDSVTSIWSNASTNIFGIKRRKSSSSAAAGGQGIEGGAAAAEEKPLGQYH